MRGVHGLTFVLSGVVVAFAMWAGVGTFRDIDPRAIQAIEILSAFGLAVVIVGLIGRVWGILNDASRDPR